MLLTILIFLLILSVLVFVHELGHFATARFFGVRCDEFGMGLPPRAIGWQKKDGRFKVVWGNREIGPDEPMVYSINWIPVGGFVKIKGENGEAVAEADSFGHKKIWQRNLILSAGVSMNVLLCIILLAIGFAIGMPTAISDNQAGTIVKEPQVQVFEVLAGYPAQSADIRVGDIILAINGEAIKSSTQLQSAVSQKEGQEIIVSLQRQQELLEKKIKVEKKGETASLGVGIVDLGVVRYPLHVALWQAIKMTWGWLVMIIMALVGLVKQLFGGSSAGVEFAGPVGIAVLTGQAAKLGWIYILQFAALLSLNLALINILPFPALDGGRIMFLTIGKLRGKMINEKLENFSHNLGFILLMALIVFITYKDIIKYGGKILMVLKSSLGL